MLQARDKTINGISLYKHALIDIFSLIDCKWHNVKITEISKTDKTIQYQGIFNNDIKGAIYYTRYWWQIAKYKSKDVGDETINTLFALKHTKQNMYKHNVLIFGYLETKRRSNGEYIKKYFEIKDHSQYMFCYNNQSKNKYIFKLDLIKITRISIDPIGSDHLSFSVSTSKLNSNDDIKTVYFKCRSFNDLVDWVSILQYFHKYPPDQDKEYNQIIFQGIIEKKGQHNKSWKKRYFVLRNEHLWYSNIEDKYELNKHKKIDLNDVIKICIIDDNDLKHYKFHIIQRQKKFSLRVKTKEERKKWKYFIEQQCNKLQHEVFQ